MTGGQEIQLKLRGLETKVANKVGRQAVRAGAKVIQATAKAEAQGQVGGSMGGLISRALVVRAAKKQRRGNQTVQVLHNPKYNAELTHTTSSGQQFYIPNAIEYGHAKPFGTSGVGASGEVRPIPYMRTTFQKTRAMARMVTEQTLIAGIKREWA
jgi:HK97 gp10 family phage protein